VLKIGLCMFLLSGCLMFRQPVQADCQRYDGRPCRYDPDKEDPPYNAEDNRLNPYDAIASATAYCRTDGSLDVFAISASQGIFLYKVSGQDIARAVSQAQQHGQAILLQAQQSVQLWAGPDGQLSILAPDGYHFSFPASSCGTALPAAVPPKLPPSTVGIAHSGKTTASLDIHRWADAHSQSLGHVAWGEKVVILGRDVSEQWVKIQYKGLTGWILSCCVGLSPAAIRALPVT
jgi:hypothetical protein